MEEKKFEEISITEVCKEAKIGRVTFYRHYDTLEDVLRKRSDDLFEGFIPYFIDYNKRMKMNSGLLRPFLRYWYVNPKIIEMIIQADKTYILNSSMEKLLSISRPMAVEKNIIELEEDSYFSAVVNSVVLCILIEWIKKGQNVAPDDLADRILKKMKKTIESNTFI
jgi:AcrR family transcriptional regulator